MHLILVFDIISSLHAPLCVIAHNRFTYIKKKNIPCYVRAIVQRRMTDKHFNSHVG